jgi:hypothetical protein
MCFQSQVLEFFTQDEPFRRNTPYIIDSKKLQRCCHIDMTEKGGCVSCSTCISFTVASSNSGNTTPIYFFPHFANLPSSPMARGLWDILYFCTFKYTDSDMTLPHSNPQNLNLLANWSPCGYRRTVLAAVLLKLGNRILIITIMITVIIIR